MRIIPVQLFLVILLGGQSVLGQDVQHNPKTVEGPPADNTVKSSSSDDRRHMDVIPFSLPMVAPGKEMTITEAIALTDQHSTTLQAAVQQLESAKADLYKARAGLFPTFSGSVTYGLLDHEDSSTIAGMEIVTREKYSLSGGLDFQLPLVNGSIWKGIDVAKKGTAVSELSVETVRQSLLLAVAEAYYQALATKNLIASLEEQALSTARYLVVAKARFMVGVGKRLDIVRAQGDLERIRDQLLTAHVGLTNTRDVLANMTGRDYLPMPVAGDEYKGEIGTEGELVKKGMEDREDIQLNAAMVSLSNSQLGLTWMQFVPSLGFSWQLTHQFLEQETVDDQTRWTAYLLLSVPIYTQTRYADLDKARATQKQYELDAADTASSAKLEIRRARRNWETAVERVSVASTQSKLSKESLTLTESEYVSGTGSSLEVTDARRSYNDAVINLATKQFESQTALLSLLRAVGQDMSQLGE